MWKKPLQGTTDPGLQINEFVVAAATITKSPLVSRTAFERQEAPPSPC
jgi:hypothetical protein